MTSEKVLLSGDAAARPALGPGSAMPIALTLMALMIGVGVGGCRLMPEKIDQPTALASPYPGPKLWAVMPMRNESGTTVVDSAAMADRLAAQVARVEGISVLPVNRVLAELSQVGFDSVNSAGEAMQLMHRLEVDGLIVGTIAAWDPYEPPKIGATIQLYSRRSPDAAPAVDPRTLTGAPTGDTVGLVNRYEQPVARASGHFDAASGDVLRRLKAYAHGRVADESAAGWRGYLLSMDLYAEFVSHELTRRLLAAERQRLWRTVAPDAAEAGARSGRVEREPAP